MSKKIGIIGHFGGKENMLDGQTIKTKILFSELQEHSNWNIKTVDTYYKTHNPIKLVWNTLVCLMTRKHIIVLLSGNGMKFYFPILVFFTKIFKTRVYHDVIGGDLDIYIQNNPEALDQLNTFAVNWVETEGLRKKLVKIGVTNCEVIPNFKRLDIIQNTIEYGEKKQFNFCMFSRVMKEKGIEVAIEAIKHINSKQDTYKCSLDIFGRVDDGYKTRFEELQKSFGEDICYIGTVPYDKSAEAIKDYDALLFPTFWGGEGFPGTIVDAFSAGLPVIATNWNCNGEIVRNKVNGLLYPNKEISDLEEAIQWLMENQSALGDMKNECIASAKEYQPDKYIKRIIDVVEKGH